MIFPMIRSFHTIYWRKSISMRLPKYNIRGSKGEYAITICWSTSWTPLTIILDCVFLRVVTKCSSRQLMISRITPGLRRPTRSFVLTIISRTCQPPFGPISNPAPLVKSTPCPDTNRTESYNQLCHPHRRSKWCLWIWSSSYPTLHTTEFNTTLSWQLRISWLRWSPSSRVGKLGVPSNGPTPFSSAITVDGAYLLELSRIEVRFSSPNSGQPYSVSSILYY